MNYQDVIDGINEVMNREIPMLLSLTDEQVSVKRNRQNRTAKMLVGHLIDSASNNHQRMVPTVCPSLQSLHAEHRDGHARLPPTIHRTMTCG